MYTHRLFANLAAGPQLCNVVALCRGSGRYFADTFLGSFGALLGSLGGLLGSLGAACEGSLSGSGGVARGDPGRLSEGFQDKLS